MREHDLPVRKLSRLQGYDYSKEGVYFVTICVKEKAEMFGRIPAVGAGFHARPDTLDEMTVTVELSELGNIVKEAIEYIGNQPGISIDHYVIMPDHLHLLIGLAAGGHGSPPLRDVVGRLKSCVLHEWNKLCGTQYVSFWQRSFHDRIVRNEQEYSDIRNYIQNNPCQWTQRLASINTQKEVIL